MLRRTLLAGASILPLSACGLNFSGAGVTLDSVKLYTDDVVDALGAGVAAYLAQRPSVVVQGVFADLQAARLKVDATVTPENARDVVKEALSFLRELSPIVLPFLAAGVAPYVPLAIDVLDAFVSATPPPPAAPPTPPPQLRRAALLYRTHRR
jgi:hypothetical protein